MKKQVTFAESGTVHTLRQDEALLRMHESKTEFKNPSSGLNISRRPAEKHEPRHQHMTQIQIPKTMTLAPFLKHTALTPAQREYLYTVTASCSAAHVRNLITQHYVNVLHRRIRTDFDTDEDPIISAALPGSHHREKLKSEAKHKEKIKTKAGNPGKSFLPKIHHRRVRFSNTSASKQGQVKKRWTSPRQRRKSPKRTRIQLVEDEEEEGQDDSLSECLSSLSVADWDDDSLSDFRHFS